jgi:hypothetical protein
VAPAVGLAALANACQYVPCTAVLRIPPRTRHSLTQHPSVAAAAFSLVHINPHRAPCTGGSCCCHQQGPSLRTGQTALWCTLTLFLYIVVGIMRPLLIMLRLSYSSLGSFVMLPCFVVHHSASPIIALCAAFCAVLLAADVECSDTVLPVTYTKFAGMMESGDTLYVGRYLVSGADSASLYLEVRQGTCAASAVAVAVAAGTAAADSASLYLEVRQGTCSSSSSSSSTSSSSSSSSSSSGRHSWCRQRQPVPGGEAVQRILVVYSSTVCKCANRALQNCRIASDRPASTWR